ncbi:TRAP transporter small permease [Stutzerimonas zhaodongensis]|uniref:TRAP transporter small permease n=1 Tax=Stutzerimonas zhaodongensis TaxID=1176257 RepID=UPI0039F078EF
MSEPVVQAVPSPADPLGRLLDLLSRLLALIGGLLLVAMTLMATYSIAMRAVFDEPLLGDVELVQMGCGIAIVFFLPLCQLRRGNVIVDVFTMNAPQRVCNSLDGLGGLLMALASALLAWRSAIGTTDAFGTGEESIIMGLPIWWSMAAFAPGFALLALVALYTAWQDFRGEGKSA